MNLMPAGPVEEVLVGGGPDASEVQTFLRVSHHVYSHDGISYVALGVLHGIVWLLAGPRQDELETALKDAGASDAEIIELRNLH